MMTFDTYAYVKRLRSAGLEEEQAAAHAEALASLLESNVAGKGDIEALSRDIEGVSRHVEGLSHDMEGLNRHVEGLSRDMEGLNRHVEGLSRDMEGLNRHVEGLSRDMEGLNRHVEGLSQDVSGLNREIEALRRDMDSRFEQARNEVEARILSVHKAVYATSGLLGLLIVAMGIFLNVIGN